MQTVISKYWSLNVHPSKPTKYRPTQNVRLTNVALSADLKDESATSRTSLRVSAHSVNSVICSLMPTKIDQAVVDIVFVKGAEFILEVVGHNDLSLSGYEFYDNVVPGIFPGSLQEINNADRLGGKPTDLVIVEKVLGTGPLVEKTSVAYFFYVIMKMDGTGVGRNNEGGDPVYSTLTWTCGNLTPTQAMINMNDTKDTMPALNMGLMGMRTGGECKLCVPPHLGGGKRPVDGIGPDEHFFLYLKLVGVESGKETL